MSIDGMLNQPWSYLAMLKGRQAEYDALRELAPRTRDLVTPLILLRELGGIGTVADLSGALDGLRRGWGQQGPIAIDGQWLEDPDTFRLAIEAARAKGWTTIPSARLTDPPGYLEVVRQASAATGAVLRVTRSDFADGMVGKRLGTVMEVIGVPADRTDLVLDLRGVEHMHVGADEVAAMSMVSLVPTPNAWRHLVLASSSIPPDFRNFPNDQVSRVPRTEAWLYQALYDRRRTLPRLPVYGDYVVGNPDPVEEVRADYLPQVALIRYSTPGRRSSGGPGR